jgi:hypothetical protein
MQGHSGHDCGTGALCESPHVLFGIVFRENTGHSNIAESFCSYLLISVSIIARYTQKMGKMCIYW